MIHEYQTGRSVCGFVEFCAWAGVIISGLLVLASFGTASRGGGYSFALAGVVPALSTLLFSFTLIVLTQMARAAMDGSVAAQKNVIQNQKQHEEMMRSFRQLTQQTAGLSDAAKQATQNPTAEENNAASEAVEATPSSLSSLANKQETITRRSDGKLEYRGQEFESEGRKLVLGGLRFETLDQIKRHIDGKLAERELEPPATTAAEAMSYKGKTISQIGPARFEVDGRNFHSRADAEVYIDFANRPSSQAENTTAENVPAVTESPEIRPQDESVNAKRP